MVRLSEIIETPETVEVERRPPRRMRLSDAMRMGSYEIPEVEGIDKGVGGNIIEGVLKGFASAPQVLGNVTMAYGDYVRSAVDKAEKQGVIFGIKPIVSTEAVRGIGQRVFEAGKKITENNERFIQQKFPEQANLTFADKFAQGVGQGSVSLAAALGLGVVAGPIAPAIAFGLVAGSEGFLEARAKDKDLDDAVRIGGVLGLTEGGLEFWGVNRLIKLKGGSIRKLLTNAVNGMSTEFRQEFTQSSASGAIKTGTGLREFKGLESVKRIIIEALWEGAIGGVLGMGAGVSFSLFQREAVEEGLTKMGMEKEKAAEISDQLMRDAIEDTTTAVETLPEALELPPPIIGPEGEVIPLKIPTEEELAEGERIVSEQIAETIELIAPEGTELRTFIDKQLQQEIGKEQRRLDELEVAEFAQQELGTLVDLMKGRINKAKNPDIAEELKPIPAVFATTDKNGLAADEALDELITREVLPEGSGVGDLVEFLVNLDQSFKQSKERVVALKPKLVKKREPTILKEKIKSIKRGFRLGKIVSKKEISTTQESLIEQLKRSGLEAKDKAKFISTIKNIQTVDQLQKALPEISERIEALEVSQAKRTVQTKINKELKRTKPLKVGQKRIGKFDLERNRLFDSIRQFNKMSQSQALAELEKLPDEPKAEADLMKKRFLSLKANGKRASVEIHNQVLEDIIRLKKIGETAKSEADFKKQLERVERVDEALEGIGKVKANKKTIKTMIGNTYRRGFSNIWSMLNSMFGKEIADKYNTELAENSKRTAIFIETDEMTTEMGEIYGREDAFGILEDLAREKYQITDEDGLTTEITKLQLIDIFNSLKNERTRKRYNDTFGENQIVYLMGELNTQDRNFADYLQEVVQGYRSVMNQRHIEITGRDLGFVENYWPATSERQIDVFDDILVQGETPSALKERAKGKVIPIPKDAWLKAQRHISQGEHVENISRRHETLKRVFTDRKVKHSIEQKFGEGVYNVLVDQINESSLNATTRNIDDVTKVFGSLVNNWVTAKVAIPNVNVFVRQLLSVGNFAEEMNSGEWVKGFVEGVQDPKKTFEFMWKNAPFLEARFNRGFSEALQNAIEGAEKLNASWGQWTKFLTTLTRVGDITAIIYGGFPLVKSELAKGKSMEEAIATFEQATIRAQQSGLSASISQVQNSKNAWARLFLAFKNTTTQYLRKMSDAIISFQNGDISKEQFIKTMFIYMVIQPTLYASSGVLTKSALLSMGQIFRGEGIDDDDELFGELMNKIFTQIAVSPTQAIPLIDDLSQFAVRAMTGQKVYKVFSTPLIDDLETGFKKLSKKEVTAIDYLTVLSSIVEPTTAVPAKTVMRYFKYLGPGKDKKRKLKRKGEK